MGVLKQLYRHSFELLTDLYQLTMAYGYWKSGSASKDAVFHLFFRRNPFGGRYTITAGLEYVVDMLRDYQFRDDDLAYLAELRGNDDRPMFEPAFLDALRAMRFSCDVDAVPEGTVVFPHEPLLRITGPIMQCQLLETALLNIVNFQSLIATKAARVCTAAGDDPVLEFGLRRAQGADGALAASRAAWIGGCAATSNVLAGKLFGIPVRGTHAHSWIMSFDTEPEAFQAYAEAMPNNCVFLVDTYDTLQGVRHAVEAGRMLRAAGHELAGIRLDSGDLGNLSREARRILDEGGFPEAAIVASNDLDEASIARLRQNDAAIGVWGVGTRLVTGDGQPALGGVYKLSAIRQPGEDWSYRIKLSEHPGKVSNPGLLQVCRLHDGTRFLRDVIFSIPEGIDQESRVVDLADTTRLSELDSGVERADLLVPVFREGRCVLDLPSVETIRDYRAEQMRLFRARITEKQTDQYPVGLESRLFDLKNRLMKKLQARYTSDSQTH